MHDTQKVEPDIFLQVPAELRYVSAIGQFAEGLLKHVPQVNSNEHLAYSIQLSIVEACSNVARHAYPETEENKILQVKIWIMDNRIIIEVIDFGKGFQCESIPEPCLDEPQEGGMGLFIIKQSVDVFSYTQTDGKNILHLEKAL